MQRLLVVGSMAVLAISSGAWAAKPVTLRVALYPYVPAGDTLFLQLEQGFEAKHPGVNVELVTQVTDADGQSWSLGDTYYGGAGDQAGVLLVDADVIEVDTVLLRQMVEAKRIQPIALPDHDFLSVAQDAVTWQGQTWAAPHWVCGNFLIYDRAHSEIARAETWEALAAVADTALMLDLKGSSTLGEWALSAAAGRSPEAVEALLHQGLDDQVAADVQTLLGACQTGFCRNDPLHNNTGAYGRLFARHYADAYVGYSESMFYLADEVGTSCMPFSACRQLEDVAVAALPPVVAGGRRVGWVDGLAVGAETRGKKRALALDFIDYATTAQTYEQVLVTPSGRPRYLLPAIEDWTQFSPPLYGELESAFGDRLVLSEGSGTLRQRGKALDQALDQSE